MITLNVTPQGADLIIAALRQLPHSQVHDLVMDLYVQAKSQQAIVGASEPAPTTEEVSPEVMESHTQ